MVIYSKRVDLAKILVHERMPSLKKPLATVLEEEVNDRGKSNVARSQMRNFSSVSTRVSRGCGARVSRFANERNRAQTKEEGSKRLGKPRISWTAGAPFVSDRVLPPPPRHHTSYWRRRVSSIAATNNATPDLHDWIGVAKLKLPPATGVLSLYRHANAGN